MSTDRHNIKCATCGEWFQAAAVNKFHCSVECRMRSIATPFLGLDGCWAWPGSRNPQTGYGQLSTWDGKRRLFTAHRVSYAAFNGPVAAGQYVLHRCDNRACFNPQHLFLGTHQSNMDDMEAKGRRRSRAQRGEQHPMAKLTAAEVQAIRAADDSLGVIAQRFGMSKSAVCSIRKRRSWSHV